jgi:hypothetical protein
MERGIFFLAFFCFVWLQRQTLWHFWRTKKPSISSFSARGRVKCDRVVTSHLPVNTSADQPGSHLRRPWVDPEGCSPGTQTPNQRGNHELGTGPNSRHRAHTPNVPSSVPTGSYRPKKKITSGSRLYRAVWPTPAFKRGAKNLTTHQHGQIRSLPKPRRA